MARALHQLRLMLFSVFGAVGSTIIDLTIKDDEARRIAKASMWTGLAAAGAASGIEADTAAVGVVMAAKELVGLGMEDQAALNVLDASAGVATTALSGNVVELGKVATGAAAGGIVGGALDGADGAAKGMGVGARLASGDVMTMAGSMAGASSGAAVGALARDGDSAAIEQGLSLGMGVGGAGAHLFATDAVVSQAKDLRRSFIGEAIRSLHEAPGPASTSGSSPTTPTLKLDGPEEPQVAKAKPPSSEPPGKQIAPPTPAEQAQLQAIKALALKGAGVGAGAAMYFSQRARGEEESAAALAQGQAVVDGAGMFTELTPDKEVGDQTKKGEGTEQALRAEDPCEELLSGPTVSADDIRELAKASLVTGSALADLIIDQTQGQVLKLERDRLSDGDPGSLRLAEKETSIRRLRAVVQLGQELRAFDLEANNRA